MKSALFFIWEIGKIVIISLLVVVPIRYFIFQPFFVRGYSMEPNFSSGDYLIIDQVSYRFRDVQRGEVVVFKHPNNPSQRHIKRIVGLQGETIKIENDQISIYKDGLPQILDESNYLPSEYSKTTGSIEIRLDENEFFVLGDNRSLSADSRRWGPLPKKDIIGRVFFRAWPFTAMAKIEAPQY